MSMKRVLGMMLASRMAGRGMRGRGGFPGGGLGGMAAAGLIGGRRGGLGRKAGLAALGYMAYRAYQDHQAKSAGKDDRAGTSAADAGNAHPGGSASDAGLGGLLGGVMKSVSDALGGVGTQDQATGRSASGSAQRSTAQAFTAEDERAADELGEDKALLLLRAMIAAAHADGDISAEERSRIMSQAEDADDRRTLERELAAPRPLEELLAEVRDAETAEEFYLSSRMAVDGETSANRAYLARLRDRLGLAEQDAAEIEALASGPV